MRTSIFKRDPYTIPKWMIYWGAALPIAGEDPGLFGLFVFGLIGYYLVSLTPRARMLAAERRWWREFRRQLTNSQSVTAAHH